jgi:uncharacterized damage-inducible protein DinB
MTASDLGRDLEAARRRLLASISGVTEDQFKERPAPTSGDPAPWSIAEVLAHMLWIELLWAGRMALVFKDGASITPSEPEAHLREAAAGRRAPVPQLIHGLVAARRQVERGFAGLDDEALARDVWHPRLQERLSLAWMVTKIIGHENEHTDQIEEIRTRIGAPLPVFVDPGR